MAWDENRIPTTHVGSLPRPRNLLDMMKYRLTGDGHPVTDAEFNSCVRDAVAESVKRQVDCGLDIVTDGETSKVGFFTYIKDRIAGFEERNDAKVPFFDAEVSAFPEYYEEYFARAMMGGAVAPVTRMFCTGPVSYTGGEQLQKDIENLRAAADSVGAEDVFMPSTAPSGVGYNDYYKTDEEYFEAVGEAMRIEYKAITDAGFVLQVDDPALSDIFGDPELDSKQKQRKADIYVHGINHALRGIPEDKVRFHTCYGINEGPRIFEPQLSEVIGHILKINAGAYSFEAANPRHEHDYHVFDEVKLPHGKAIIPGIITHASNIVEHPELIAEWLCRFARLVGRENVIAGADCGFSSQANYKTEVHPTVIWAKFDAMVEGARIASEKLW